MRRTVSRCQLNKEQRYERALIPTRLSSFIESCLRTNSHLRLIKSFSKPDFTTSDGRQYQHLILERTHVVAHLELKEQSILLQTDPFLLSMSDESETWVSCRVSRTSDFLLRFVSWLWEDLYLERVILDLFSTTKFVSFGKIFAAFLVFLFCFALVSVSLPAFTDSFTFSPASFIIKQAQVLTSGHFVSVAVPSLSSSGQLRGFFHSERFSLSRADIYQFLAVSLDVTPSQVSNLLWHKSPRYSYRVTSSLNLHFEQQNGVLLSFKICSALRSSFSAKSQCLFLTYRFPSKTHHRNSKSISYKPMNGSLSI